MTNPATDRSNEVLAALRDAEAVVDQIRTALDCIDSEHAADLVSRMNLSAQQIQNARNSLAFDRIRDSTVDKILQALDECQANEEETR